MDDSNNCKVDSQYCKGNSEYFEFEGNIVKLTVRNESVCQLIIARLKDNDCKHQKLTRSISTLDMELNFHSCTQVTHGGKGLMYFSTCTKPNLCACLAIYLPEYVSTFIMSARDDRTKVD